MDKNPEQYRLSEDEHQAIFEKEIKPDLFANKKASDRPVAVIFGGQPGAGKSAAVAAAMAELETQGGAVKIEGDALREYHPMHDWLMTRDDRTAAFYTDRDSGAWVEKAIAAAKARRVNIVIEGTMRNGDVVAATMKDLREAGYQIDARALAVNFQLSEQGILMRYEGQKKDRGSGRMTTPEAHKAGYDGVPQTLERIEREMLADRVTLYRRGGEVIYSNALESGGWKHEAKARAVVEAERARPMTLAERKAYVEGFDKLATMLSHPERHASTREIAHMEQLRHHAHTLYAIEKNRESVSLMERSYARQDDAKQAELKTARQVLDKVEMVVSHKAAYVDLSKIAPTTLALVKPAIQALERSGITVHHELRQQWQSEMQSQMDHGHERSTR